MNLLEERSNNLSCEVPVPVQKAETGIEPVKLLLLTLKLFKDPEATEGSNNDDGNSPSRRLLDKSTV